MCSVDLSNKKRNEPCEYHLQPGYALRVWRETQQTKKGSKDTDIKMIVLIFKWNNIGANKLITRIL